MESLLFFLVLIVIIISNIARIKKKQMSAAEQKEQPRQQESDWKKNLKNILAEMQGEIQGTPGQARKSAPQKGRSTGWEDILSAEDLAGEKTESSSPPVESRPEARRQPVSLERGKTLIESRSSKGWTPEARMGKTQRPIPAPPLAGMAGDVRRKVRSLRISRNELRKAIVWYEVLGPPMSLRDSEREMWL
ncbi:MAG: hypothetical protein ACLFUN_06960 [Desulfobacterales bacterium]